MRDDNDPVLDAYTAATEEQREAFRALFSSGTYTDSQIAVALEYLLGVALPRFQVQRFRRNLEQGKVTWND